MLTKILNGNTLGLQINLEKINILIILSCISQGSSEKLKLVGYIETCKEDICYRRWLTWLRSSTICCLQAGEPKKPVA